MRRRPAEILLVAAFLLALAPGAAAAGTVEVRVKLPIPERIDMTGIDTLLITRLVLLTDNPRVDLNKEMTGLMKREIRKNTPLQVLDVEPPPLPEQSLDQLTADSSFWRDMAEKYGADLILTGSLGYESSDRSGFVQEDAISPVTGQRIRRTRFADRQGFKMHLHLYFLQGRTGKLVYDDKFSEDTTLEGRGNDPLTALFTMFDHIEPDVMGIMAHKDKTETRTLFTD